MVTAAAVFGWKPKNMLARVARVLPAVFEQHVYLAVVKDFKFHPETLAKILQVFRGNRPLSATTLERRAAGNGLRHNPFGDFADFLEAVIQFQRYTMREGSSLTFSITLSAEIVAAYGNDAPERIVEAVLTNLEECCEYYGIHRGTDEFKARKCLWRFLKHTLPALRERGIPDTLDLSELFSQLAHEMPYRETREPDYKTIENTMRNLGGWHYGD